MTMWILIMWTVIVFVIASLFYLGARVPNLLEIESIKEWGRFKQFSLGLLITLGISGIILLCMDFINAMVCIMYLAMIWFVCDLTFWAIEKFGHITFEHYYAGWIAIFMSVFALAIGWYSAHHISETKYHLITPKNVPGLRIVMFADSHIGTTFDDKGFAKHLKSMQSQNPDLIAVVGDYVDDATSKEQMINATRALGKIKTKYGIYYVSGNHDKGYYGASHRGFSEKELFDELKNNSIKILQDESILIDNAFYLIGRRDKDRGRRRNSMQDLVKGLDKSRYMIVLDHQPVEFNQQTEAGVDLVLCGHTHGGQLFPFNQVGKWINVNDMIYGHENRKNTDFIVTSGISDWAIKFKTGTKSEFVIIDINKAK